jgi:hypothetical protein
LLLSIIALADFLSKDSAISRKVKNKEPDGGLHGPTRENLFLSVIFWHVKLLLDA